MILKINGNFVCDFNEEITLEIPEAEARKIDAFLGHLKRNKRAYMTMAYSLALLTLPGGPAAAATAGGLNGGLSLIVLLQKASFWVGLGITIWGLVEMQLDAPGWKGRIMKGVLGYIAILLIPLVFLELQNSLQADVWEQIKNTGTPVGGGGQ